MSSPSQHYRDIDFRSHPELYRIGRGEEGVLTAEPYKSELLPHWRFRNPEIARSSAEKIYQRYLEYKAQSDFVGMDMARKYLQMGYTRSMRYARHRSGRKYDGSAPSDTQPKELPLAPDPEKGASAAVFQNYLLRILEDQDYKQLKATHLNRYGLV